MAALNRFILKLGEQGLPFFILLKHQEKFAWTAEADQAPSQLKDFLSKPLVLTAPRKRSNYCSTSLRLLMWSVLPSFSSGRKKATPTQSSDQSTLPVRSCQSPRHGTSRYRSYSTQCSSPCESYDITSRSTRSSSSLTTRSVTYFTIKTLLEESLSGQLNLAPSTSTSSHVPLLLMMKFHQPSHEFTFGVGISFTPYPLVLTLLVQQVHSCMSVLEFSVYVGF
jgi:hypothetical protein